MYVYKARHFVLFMFRQPCQQPSHSVAEMKNAMHSGDREGLRAISESRCELAMPRGSDGFAVLGSSKYYVTIKICTIKLSILFVCASYKRHGEKVETTSLRF